MNIEQMAEMAAKSLGYGNLRAIIILSNTE